MTNTKIELPKEKQELFNELVVSYGSGPVTEPIWTDGRTINEPLFAEEFLKTLPALVRITIVQPSSPVAPVAPVLPVAPVAPVFPVLPVAPVAPVAPVFPVAPVAPV